MGHSTFIYLIPKSESPQDIRSEERKEPPQKQFQITPRKGVHSKNSLLFSHVNLDSLAKFVRSPHMWNKINFLHFKYWKLLF
jgi:hypothetical protein